MFRQRKKINGDKPTLQREGFPHQTNTNLWPIKIENDAVTLIKKCVRKIGVRSYSIQVLCYRQSQPYPAGRLLAHYSSSPAYLELLFLKPV